MANYINKGGFIMTKQEKSWILYDWANSAYSIAITTAILPIFFKDVVAKGVDPNMSTAYWGYASSLSTLLISILAPILGAIADYKNFKKRLFTGFFFVGVVATGLLVTLNQGDFIKCIVIYTLSVIGFSGANIFYDAFLVDVTEEKKMDWISSLGFGFGYIGSTIPFIVGIIFIMKPSLIGLGSTVAATKLAFFITAVWWLIFTIPMIKNVKQKYYIEPSKHVMKESLSRLLDTIKHVKEYKVIFMFLIAYFFYIDGVSTIIRMSSVYGRDVGISGNNLLIILLVVQFVAFPFAILYGKLAEKYSAKTMLLIGIVIYTGLTFYAYFIKSVLGYWILAMLVASSQGGIQALSRSFYGKIIPKNKSSEFFGLYNILGRFSSILGPFLMAIVTQLTGNSRLGVFSLVILFVIGGGLLLKVNYEEGNAKNEPLT